MNEKDQHDAERLDAYISATQRGKRTTEEYPFVDQLFAMAESIDVGPKLREKVFQTMNTKTLVYHRFRWATVAAAIALVLVAFITVPALRSFASDLFNIFAVQESDQNPALQPTVAAPPEGAVSGESIGPKVSWGLTLEQMEAKIDASTKISLELLTPSYLPPGFSFDSGMVDENGRMLLLIYVSDDRLTNFTLRTYDLTKGQVEFPLGASSTIEKMTVNGLTGQYVQGDYSADGSWDPDAPVQNLAWRDGDVLYSITTYEQNVKISQAELLAVAESITP
jgi:hypothetical protein